MRKFELKDTAQGKSKKAFHTTAQPHEKALFQGREDWLENRLRELETDDLVDTVEVVRGTQEDVIGIIITHKDRSGEPLRPDKPGHGGGKP